MGLRVRKEQRQLLMLFLSILSWGFNYALIGLSGHFLLVKKKLTIESFYNGGGHWSADVVWMGGLWRHPCMRGREVASVYVASSQWIGPPLLKIGCMGAVVGAVWNKGKGGGVGIVVRGIVWWLVTLFLVCFIWDLQPISCCENVPCLFSSGVKDDVTDIWRQRSFAC